MPDVNNFPSLEKEVLSFWQSKNIVGKVDAKVKDAPPFVFYDGPPFTSGMPHYGHILQMAIKDAVLRYKTMQGYKVPRRIGWDTHGLPIEYQLERELGISGKHQIEEMGIDKFTEAARNIVLRWTEEWKSTMTRMGRWVDVDHPYKTMDNDYIESVWWAFKELAHRDLLYTDFRVSPYCPRCGTVLANFEVNQGYKDNVSDPAVFVALTITSDGEFKDKKIVFWTTTPWTIPAVVAMAVNPDADYGIFETNDHEYILAVNSAASLFANVKAKKVFRGRDLVGLKYRPPYSLCLPVNRPGGKPSGDSNAYRIVAGNHVLSDEGTEIVSVAPAYGEIDSQVGKAEKLPLVQTIEPDGTVKKGLGIPGEGKEAKKADADIIDDLEKRHFLVKKETIKHTYPFCWRCDSPLLYYPVLSWYVKTTAIKDRLIEENNEIKWQPEHIRDGRFGKWLEGVRDWAVSRDRYWGAPLPVWECDACGHQLIFGSRDELLQYGDFDLSDMHRPAIDNIKFACPSCKKGTMKRVTFVFDCWFESGSMPFAQDHYPFNKGAIFNPDKNIGYPADFISEGLDQTRGWFYVLHALGVALFNQKAFKTVDVTGLILDTKGTKLSKRWRNYPEPEELFDKEGVDALRLFLFTNASLGEDYRFSEDAVKDVKRRWLVTLANVVNYYQLSLVDADDKLGTLPQHKLLDEWLQARLAQAVEQVYSAMEGSKKHSPYDIVMASRTFGPLVEELSAWYVRLSRGRKDTQFTQSLLNAIKVIVTTYAPFFPFVTESIYQQIKSAQDAESVHLLNWPKVTAYDKSVLASMNDVQSAVSLGRELRASHKIANRQPLAKFEILVKSGDDFSSAAAELISQELQVGRVTIVSKLDGKLAVSENDYLKVGLDIQLTPELELQGAANGLRRLIQDLRKQAGLNPQNAAVVVVDTHNDELVSRALSQLSTTSRTTAIAQSEPSAEGEFNLASEKIAVRLYKK